MAEVLAAESVHPAFVLYENLRAYRNVTLIHKLQSELEIDSEAALSLFEDVKKFLALCASTSQALAPTRQIDLGWHAFILFTQDYDAFCKKYLGRFIHHSPEDPFSDVKDFDAIPLTREFATLVFGSLSSNWQSWSNTTCEKSSVGSDAKTCNKACKQVYGLGSKRDFRTCQGKDCSQPDCTSCKGAP